MSIPAKKKGTSPIIVCLSWPRRIVASWRLSFSANISDAFSPPGWHGVNDKTVWADKKRPLTALPGLSRSNGADRFGQRQGAESGPDADPAHNECLRHCVKRVQDGKSLTTRRHAVRLSGLTVHRRKVSMPNVRCCVAGRMSRVSVHFDVKTAQNRRIKSSFSLPRLRSKRRVTPKLLLTRPKLLLTR